MAFRAFSIVLRLDLNLGTNSFNSSSSISVFRLNSNFWLATHVTTITIGYGASLMAGCVGHLYLIQEIRGVNSASLKSIFNNLFGITLLALFFTLFGTILGGIWADQSWGRFWGWDPKETWALISIIIYTAVLHLRIVPKLNNKWLFNLMSIISFAAIMMTYFGVNFYLVGLHSYASGDKVITPDFVYYSTVFVFILGLISYFANKKNQVL